VTRARLPARGKLQRNHLALARGLNAEVRVFLRRKPARSLQHVRDLCIIVRRIVMEEKQPPHLRPDGEIHHVLHAAVAPAGVRAVFPAPRSLPGLHLRGKSGAHLFMGPFWKNECAILSGGFLVACQDYSVGTRQIS
jgi:hypothetical protein